jgi:TorA maturation chaperone TorD
MTIAHPPQLDHTSAGDAACEVLYRFLSAALADPSWARWRLIFDVNNQDLVCWSADFLRDQFADRPAALGLGELPVVHLDTRPLIEQLGLPEHELRNEHLRVFGMTSRDCSPYETEYHSVDDTFFRTQQMADVAGFYRAFGLDFAGQAHDRADHISLELEFVAYLLMKKRLAAASAASNPTNAEQADTCHQARVAFLRDHLCWWTPAFAHLLARKADGGFYAATAKLLAALLPVDRSRLGIEPAPPPSKPADQDLSSLHECGACALAKL